MRVETLAPYARANDKGEPMFRLDDATDANDGDEGSQLARYLQSDEPGPLEHLEDAERRQFVRDSVEQLPEFLKQVVLLTFFQGLKQSEIGAILKIPVGTVKSRMHTALARLMQVWEEQAAAKEM